LRAAGLQRIARLHLVYSFVRRAFSVDVPLAQPDSALRGELCDVLIAGIVVTIFLALAWAFAELRNR